MRATAALVAQGGRGMRLLLLEALAFGDEFLLGLALLAEKFALLAYLLLLLLDRHLVVRGEFELVDPQLVVLGA